MAQMQFDARGVTPDAGIGDPLPTGWYNAMIDDSEIKPTNDATGTRLNLRFTILDGKHKGRKVFHGLNIVNQNAKSVEISRAQLSAICHAVGHLFIQNDTSELHGKPLKIRVTLRAATPEVRDPVSGIVTQKAYEASNDVKAFRNINEVVDMAEATAPGAHPAAPANWGAPVQPAQPQYQPTQQFAQQHQQPAAQAPQQWAPPAAAPAQPPVQAQQYAPPVQAQPPQTAAYAAPQPGAGASQPWSDPNAAAQYQPPQAQQFAPPPFQQPAAPATMPAGATPPWAQ